MPKHARSQMQTTKYMKQKPDRAEGSDRQIHSYSWELQHSTVRNR